MSLIRRYIAKEFVTFFLVCSLSLLFIAIVFSTLAELPNLEKENGVQLFINAILSGIPLLVEVIVPITVLLATVLALISLSKTSEIIAMMAAGVSLFHLILPILLCGGVISGLMYLNQSYLASYWGADERAGLVAAKRSANTWRFHNNTLYYFEAPNKRTGSILSSRFFSFGKDKRIGSTGFSSNLFREENAWDISQERRIEFQENGIRQTVENDVKTAANEMPVVFTNDLVNPKYTSFASLISEILIKRNGAVNYKPDLFALYQKIAGLFSIFVMILLALPFSIYSGRSANVRTGIVVSIVLGFVFWLVDQILLSFNTTGMLPMGVSAFGANIGFLILAFTLIRLKKT